MTDLIAATYGALEPIRGSRRHFALSAARSPSPEARQALAVRRTELQRALVGSEPEAVLRAVSMMRVSLASEAMDPDTRNLLKTAFIVALSPYPRWSIEAACLLYLRGQEGDGKFAPKPPEVALVCRRLVQEAQAEAMKIDAILAADVIASPTEAEREAAKARADALLADLAKAKDMRRAVSERPVVEEAERQAAEARLAAIKADLTARKLKNEHLDAEGEAA